jgi:hypothetical protein
MYVYGFLGVYKAHVCSAVINKISYIIAGINQGCVVVCFPWENLNFLVT